MAKRIEERRGEKEVDFVGSVFFFLVVAEVETFLFREREREPLLSHFSLSIWLPRGTGRSLSRSRMGLRSSNKRPLTQRLEQEQQRVSVHLFSKARH